MSEMCFNKQVSESWFLTNFKQKKCPCLSEFSQWLYLELSQNSSQFQLCLLNKCPINRRVYLQLEHSRPQWAIFFNGVILSSDNYYLSETWFQCAWELGLKFSWATLSNNSNIFKSLAFINARVTACAWRPEESFLNLFLSYLVGSRDRTQETIIGC